MTPSMGMAAPKGTQAPAAGLAAIAQPATAPRGKSPENMGEIMSLARRMSDAQLADVLSGKSLDVPQFAAMTEAMGRKSLRQAVQGQQAMAQAKKPSLKDQLMGEYQQEQMAQMAARAPQGGGIPNIPAPNMESMDMASGGIVAFDSGGEVPRFFAGGSDLEEALKKRDDEENLKSGFYNSLLKGFPSALDKTEAKALEKAAAKRTEGSSYIPNSVASVDNRDIGSVVASPSASADGPTQAQRDAFYEKSKIGTGVGNASGNQPFSIPSFEQLQGKKSTDFLSKLEGLSDKQRAGIAQLKKEGGGEALLQMAAAVFGSPNLAQAAAKGLPMVASTSAATRKEARAVENLANEYDLNLAKSREAAEKGDMALALQYQQLANQAKAQSDTAAYQQGRLGIEGQRNAMLQGQYDSVKIPGQLGKLYADATKAVKDMYGGMVPPSKQKEYAAAIETEYRKRAQAVGLGKQVDLYSPGATNPGFNLVQSPPKGAKIYDLSAGDET